MNDNLIKLKEIWTEREYNINDEYFELLQELIDYCDCKLLINVALVKYLNQEIVLTPKTFLKYLMVQAPNTKIRIIEYEKSLRFDRVVGDIYFNLKNS